MSGTNQTNGADPMSEEERQQLKLQRLKTCQTLITVALIGAPVSLLIGGVALSIASLVCAIIAFARMRKTMEPSDGPGSLARTLYVQSIVALVASCAATCLNAVAFVFMFGAVSQALQTGDFSNLFETFGGSSESGSSSSRSVWD